MQTGFRVAAGLLLLATIGAMGTAATMPVFRGAVVAREDPEEIKYWGEECSIYCAISPTVRASSSLKSADGTKYSGEQGQDLDLGTAWVEGAKGSGIGEYLEYTIDMNEMENSPLVLTELIVFNGYRKSRDLWEKNGRVKTMAMSVNGKPYGTVSLADAYKYQRVKIGSIPLLGKKKTIIRFTIQSVYPGTKYDDTALTELEFDGTGHH